jgi:hypothetical protein
MIPSFSSFFLFRHAGIKATLPAFDNRLQSPGIRSNQPLFAVLLMLRDAKAIRSQVRATELRLSQACCSVESSREHRYIVRRCTASHRDRIAVFVACSRSPFPLVVGHSRSYSVFSYYALVSVVRFGSLSCSRKHASIKSSIHNFKPCWQIILQTLRTP